MRETPTCAPPTLKNLFVLDIRTLSDAMVIERKRRAISLALLVLFGARIDGLFRHIGAFLARNRHAPNRQARKPAPDDTRIPFGPSNRFWPPDHKRRQI